MRALYQTTSIDLFKGEKCRTSNKRCSAEGEAVISLVHALGLAPLSLTEEIRLKQFSETSESFPIT